jgi:hypothetical protein
MSASFIRVADVGEAPRPTMPSSVSAYGTPVRSAENCHTSPARNSTTVEISNSGSARARRVTNVGANARTWPKPHRAMLAMPKVADR